MERFHCSFRYEVPDGHLFDSFGQGRDIVHWWLPAYNEERPHEGLGNLPATVIRKQLSPTPTTNPSLRNPTFEMSH